MHRVAPRSSLSPLTSTSNSDVRVSNVNQAKKLDVFSFEAAKGRTAEPSITDEEMLQSFITYGAFLRVLAAWNQVHVLRKPESTEAEKIAASAAFYQQLSLFLEDALATFLAWGLWKRSGGRLADKYAAISFRRDSSSFQKALAFSELVSALTCRKQSKTVIAPAVLGKSLAATDPAVLLNTIGVSWKPYAAAPLRRGRQSGEWTQLFNQTKSLCETLGQDAIRRLTEYHNKIKHGPQVIIQSPFEVLERRGLSASEASTKQLGLLPVGYLRILLAGSRVERNEYEERERIRIAPFVIHAPASYIEHRFFGTLVFGAFTLRLVALWVYRFRFGSFPDETLDKKIAELSAAWAAYGRSSSV